MCGELGFVVGTSLRSKPIEAVKDNVVMCACMHCGEHTRLQYGTIIRISESLPLGILL